METLTGDDKASRPAGAADEPATPARTVTYPIRGLEQDPRFTIGLTIDVMDVLVAHGYPRPDGLEVVDLQQALFRFLYVGDR